jgi:predicted nucleic acid-binding protein
VPGGGCRRSPAERSLLVPDPKPFRDGLIAATAHVVSSLVVVSRNLADFSEATGVPLFNPWQQG